MKILLIRLSSIGDIILTTPIIRAIKVQLPNARLHLLTKNGFVNMMSANPHLSKIHAYESEKANNWKSLKNEKFDFIIDLHQNIRTNLVKMHLSGRKASFEKLNIEKWLFTSFKINIMPQMHIVDRYFSPAKKLLGIENDNLGLEYYIPATTPSIDSLLPNNFKKSNYLAVAVGAALATKQIPLKLLQQVLLTIDMPIVLLGGPEDQSKAENLSALLPNAYNGCGKFSLHQSAKVLQSARALLTADTGLMHIGTAFKIPMVVVWGNTVPQFGMGPYFGSSKIDFFFAEVNNLPCRPCSKIGYPNCPKRHFNCMENQDATEITKMLQKIIQKPTLH